MRPAGKKVGKFCVSTQLGEYQLDVRLDVERSIFLIYVPPAPGIVSNDRSDYLEVVRAPTLEELKKSVKELLVKRDVTKFEDVIEYSFEVPGQRDRDLRIGFDFRVARVSESRNKRGSALLEILIEVDEEGEIHVRKDLDGEPYPMQKHHYSLDHSMPYTASRWRKCRQIRDGIAALGEALQELLAEDGVGDRLDAIGKGSPLLLEGVKSSRETP